MILNNKEIDIENITKDLNFDKNMHIKRQNGLILSDKQIDILNKYNIDYLKFNNISSLIYEIEDILNNDEYFDDLDNLSKELSEFNYYQNTNK